MISDKHKTVFIHIPKCAGTSMERYLQDFEFFFNGHTHTTHAEVLKLDKYKNYYKFAFVRNPYDKMVSEFKWFTNSTHKYPLKKVKKFYHGTTFKCFLKKFFSSNVGDPYHRYDYMKILKPLEQMDFIGRFENLHEDFNNVCRNIGISGKTLPHNYKTETTHYTKYYDDETRQLVAEKYAKDIEYFGYKFGE